MRNSSKTQRVDFYDRQRARVLPWQSRRCLFLIARFGLAPIGSLDGEIGGVSLPRMPNFRGEGKN